MKIIMITGETYVTSAVNFLGDGIAVFKDFNNNSKEVHVDFTKIVSIQTV